MQLKVKTSNWSAGLPVAMINRETAEKIGVHAGDRISLKTLSKKPKQMATIVDVVEKNLGNKKIAVSVEIKKNLALREGQTICVSFSSTPKSVEYIKEKMVGKKLSYEKIKRIIRDVVSNTLSEPEVAVFISGMYKNGMDFEETVSLIDAIEAALKKPPYTLT